MPHSLEIRCKAEVVDETTGEKCDFFFGACKTTGSSSDQSIVRPKLNTCPVTVRMELVPSSWRRRGILEVPFSAQMGVGPRMHALRQPWLLLSKAWSLLCASLTSVSPCSSKMEQRTAGRSLHHPGGEQAQGIMYPQLTQGTYTQHFEHPSHLCPV